MFSRFAVVLAATALLGTACTNSGPAPLPADPRKAADNGSPSNTQETATPFRAGGGADSGDVEAAAMPRAPTARPAPDPIVFPGLSDDELLSLMGAPDLRRLDDPAALWQYRGTGCILDFFLYADGPVYRVHHYAFRTPPLAVLPATTAQPVDTETCLTELANRMDRS